MWHDQRFQSVSQAETDLDVRWLHLEEKKQFFKDHK